MDALFQRTLMHFNFINMRDNYASENMACVSTVYNVYIAKQ